MVVGRRSGVTLAPWPIAAADPSRLAPESPFPADPASPAVSAVGQDSDGRPPVVDSSGGDRLPTAGTDAA